MTDQELAERSFAIAFVGKAITIESALVDYLGVCRELCVRLPDGSRFSLGALDSGLRVEALPDIAGPIPEPVIWAQRERNTLPVRLVVE